MTGQHRPAGPDRLVMRRIGTGQLTHDLSTGIPRPPSNHLDMGPGDGYASCRLLGDADPDEVMNEGAGDYLYVLPVASIREAGMDVLETVVKMVALVTNCRQPFLKIRLMRTAAPTAQGGSAWESHPRTPSRSPLKPPRGVAPARQPEPDWVGVSVSPAGIVLQAPVSAVLRSHPSTSTRASLASLQVR